MPGPGPGARGRGDAGLVIYSKGEQTSSGPVPTTAGPEGSDTPATDTDTDDTRGTATVPADVVAPPGVEEDQPYLELSTSADGPVVDVYRDFLCAPCKDFQRTQGDGLIELALRGETTLRVHPRPMLDLTSDPPGYSGRAAHAAVCAYAENPEKWFPAEMALFALQPGPEGLPDHELIFIVHEATGVEIADCLAEGAYHPWLQQVVEPEALERTSGTPTVLIDGRQFSGGLGTYGSVKDAIEAA